jgi:hypothetical protein
MAYPDYLLIISQQMKKNYLKTARTIGFDFTFNVIK